MESDDTPKSLQTLEEDIARFHSKIAPKPSSSPQGMGAALRTGVELLSGVLAGSAVGIFLDRWFGTSPVLLIVCFILGAGGGFLTIYRTMQAMDKDTCDAVATAAAQDDEEE